MRQSLFQILALQKEEAFPGGRVYLIQWPPVGVLAKRVSFSAESFGTGLCLLRPYSVTGQIVPKNSNILPKSSWDSQRFHNKNSKQKIWIWSSYSISSYENSASHWPHDTCVPSLLRKKEQQQQLEFNSTVRFWFWFGGKAKSHSIGLCIATWMNWKWSQGAEIWGLALNFKRLCKEGEWQVLRNV